MANPVENNVMLAFSRNLPWSANKRDKIRTESVYGVLRGPALIRGKRSDTSVLKRTLSFIEDMTCATQPHSKRTSSTAPSYLSNAGTIT
jgi:hypothetical protein